MDRIIHHAIDVRARPDAIWRVFSDLTTWPRWFPQATSARSSSDPVWQIGGRIDIRMQIPVAGSVAITLEIVELVPAERVRWVGKSRGISGDHAYSFEDRGDWTRVTSHEVFGGWLAGAAMRLARGRIEEAAHVSLDKLRALVEEATS